MIPGRLYISRDQILFHCRFFSLRVWISDKTQWKRRLKAIKRGVQMINKKDVMKLYKLFNCLSTDKKLNVIFALISSNTIATLNSTLGVEAIINEEAKR